MVEAKSLDNGLSQYIALLLELHALSSAGRNDTEEADSIRDSMDGPYRLLDRSQITLVRGLSTDLYSLEKTSTEVLERTSDSVAESAKIEGYYIKRMYPALLDILRKHEKKIPLEKVSYLRGRCWHEMGYEKVSTLFFGHASKLSPRSGTYRYIYLDSLYRSSKHEATDQANVILGRHREEHPFVVLKAADIIFYDTKERTFEESKIIFVNLVKVIDYALVQISKLPAEEHQKSLIVGAYIELAMCQGHLGLESQARQSYDAGLQIDPGNTQALTARGIFLYASDVVSAIRDFKVAIRGQDKTVWPYFYLAHHSLLAKEFDNCKSYCDTALSMKSIDSVRAHLLEFRAIASLELGNEMQTVESDFLSALELSVKEGSILRNYELFKNWNDTQNSATDQAQWGVLSSQEAQEAGRFYKRQYHPEYIPLLSAETLR